MTQDNKTSTEELGKRIEKLEEDVRELKDNVDVMGRTIRQFFNQVNEVALSARCPPMCPTPASEA